MMSAKRPGFQSGPRPGKRALQPRGTKPHTRRSLITEILTLQFLITAVIAVIALAGLTWTSGAVIRNNLAYWAEQWAGELNELGAPFYLRERSEAVLDVERFVQKYPEISRVTWYWPDGSVFTAVDKAGPAESAVDPLAPATVADLSSKAGRRSAYLLREDIEHNRKFRLSGPIWVESFAGDGLYGFAPDKADTTVNLLGFVAVDLDFSAYQAAFQARLALACVALILLLGVSWAGGRVLLKRALRPLAELQKPLAEIAAGKRQVGFTPTRHRETQAIVTALGDTLSALEKRERYLLHLANHDPLTGLYSRHRLTTELEREVAAVAQGRRSALCFVDLDQFKYINDTCGHPAGDQLLKQAAQQLRAAVRSEDLVARFGGDEFVVLLRNVSRRQARTIANQVLEQMRSLSHVEQRHTFHLQCSIGVTAITSDRFGPHELIAQADMACQAAKNHGRNRLEFYDIGEKQNEQMMRDVQWMRRIREAQKTGGFVLHYQPLMHIRTGVISHYEALLRMQTAAGLVGPNTFLPSAMHFGLLPEIDRWVVERAIRVIAESHTSKFRFRLSVNLSPFALENESFASDVRTLLKEYRVDGDCIVFEITEQMAVRFAVTTDRQIATLRDLGCGIAVDDFGSGYSSFSYLKRLPVDYLKIDGSFVKGLTQNRIDQSMVRMVGEVARAAGLKTVAEYVQDAASLTLLAKYGIDYAQGYYIGRAVPTLPDGRIREDSPGEERLVPVKRLAAAVVKAI